MKLNITNKDQIIMSLMHYFVTKKQYTPIVVKGVNNEIWLENLEEPIKIIRINWNYIHNDEQFNFDMRKLSSVLRQVKKKTYSLKVNALNICLNVSDTVEIKQSKSISSLILNKVTEVVNNDIIKSCFPGIENDIILNSTNMETMESVTKDINKATEEKNKLFTDIFSSKKIIITNILIAICVIVFVLDIFLNNAIINFGFNNSYLVSNGDFYRLITSVFLHASWIHLIVNMYSLKIIGSQLENFIGKSKFLAVFLISGLMGSLFSVVINSGVSSVGASGAIFGLAGALVYFGYYYRNYLNDVLLKQLVPIIGLNLVLGFMVSGIDNAAHIGGLIGGYLAISSMGIKGRSDSSEQKNSTVVLFILTIFLVYMLFN